MNKLKVIILFLSLVLFFVFSGRAKADSSDAATLQNNIDSTRAIILSASTPPNLLLEPSSNFLNGIQKWVAIGLRKAYLSKYSDLYYSARNQQNLALQNLAIAQAFLQQGLLDKAAQYIANSNTNQRLWQLYDSAAFEVWQGNITKAQEIEFEADKVVNDVLSLSGKVLYIVGQKIGNASPDVATKIYAVKISAAGRSLQNESTILDFFLNWGFKGIDEAVANVALDKILDKVADTAVTNGNLSVEAGKITIDSAALINAIGSDVDISKEINTLIAEELKKNPNLTDDSINQALIQLTKLRIFKTGQENTETIIQWRIIDKTLFSIKISETWKEIASQKDYPFAFYFRFEGTDGEYFEVGIDPEPVGLGGSDAVWELKANASADGVIIQTEKTIQSEMFNTHGDGKLDIDAYAKEGFGNVSLQGHIYYFFFGNSKKETGVDTKIFKKILGSFKAKKNTAEELRVNISADPVEGAAPLNGVKLKAIVSGSAQGAINYTFYCNRSDSNTNILSGWNEKFDGIFDNPKTAVCNYSTPGAYTAKVIAERGSAPPAEARISINVQPKSEPKITKLTVQLVGPYGAPMSGLNGSLMWETQVKEYLYLIDAVGDRVPGGFVGKNDQDYSFTFRTENGIWTFDREIPAGQYTVIFKGGYSNVVGFSYSNRGISWGAFDKIITVPDSNGSWFVKIIIPEQKSWVRVNLYADIVNQVGTLVNMENASLTLVDKSGELNKCESWSCGTKDGKIKGDFGYLEGGNYTFRVENSGYATFEKVIQVPDISKIPAYDDQAYEGYGEIKLGTIVLTKTQ